MMQVGTHSRTCVVILAVSFIIRAGHSASSWPDMEGVSSSEEQLLSLDPTQQFALVFSSSEVMVLKNLSD
jgi:hypothetical protein